MTLHIFNPEHDLALASDCVHFTAPLAARRLRRDLGWLPALWAEDGDSVVVDSVETMNAQMQGVDESVKIRLKSVNFTERMALTEGMVKPWGWDKAVRVELMSVGADERLLPTVEETETIRQLSHRRTAAAVLKEIKPEMMVRECCTESEVETFVAEHGRVVVKAPWSSSGRGLRLIEHSMDSHQRGWIKNIIEAQGSVMAEPYYKKVVDFGMEYHITPHDGIVYDGLSLFSTHNGAWQGNILATEHTKETMLCRYMAREELHGWRERVAKVIGRILQGRYEGPLGVDMILYDDNGYLMVHPCVEINLRRTMGHVALSLSPTADDMVMTMMINYAKQGYKLIVKQNEKTN